MPRTCEGCGRPEGLRVEEYDSPLILDRWSWCQDCIEAERTDFLEGLLEDRQLGLVP